MTEAAALERANRALRFYSEMCANFIAAPSVETFVAVELSRIGCEVARDRLISMMP